MDRIVFEDDMLKESKIWKKPMVCFLILSTIFPLALIWNDIKIGEFILGEVFLVLTWGYFLYGYLYTYKYKVTVTKERICLKTLFKHISIETKDIKNYNMKRYKKSKFYQFSIFCEDEKILINTRFKDELERLLDDNKIE